jgi:polyphosphate kinase 2 (PPK2 family)
MAKDKDSKKGKKSKEKQKPEAAPVENPAAPKEEAAAEGPRPPMSAKEFDKEMKKLQVELVKLQEWVRVSGAKICVLFEGRDTAGKGGVIKRITERVSPRIFRVVALTAPTEREKSQMYFQRYMPHLPAAG